MLVDADDLESRLVDVESVECCLVVTVIMELIEARLGGWSDKDDTWLEEVMCVSIANEMVVDADDVESRLVDVDSFEGCLVVTVIMALIEASLGGWSKKDDTWSERVMFVSLATEMVVDADDVESRLVDVESVGDSLVVNVTMELIEAILGGWSKKDDTWSEGVMCVSIANEMVVDADDVESR